MYLFLVRLYIDIVCFNVTATTEISSYGHPLSLQDALPIYGARGDAVVDVVHDLGHPAAGLRGQRRLAHRLHHAVPGAALSGRGIGDDRSEEHTSELQSLMRISYAVLC